MERISYLDATRGFAILMVIMGHLIQTNLSSGLDHSLFEIIYSFHIPLFFFISGCSQWLSDQRKNTEQLFPHNLIYGIWDKFRSLIIPAVFWTVVVSPYMFSDRMPTWSGFSSYWFLNTLFLLSVLFLLIKWAGNFLGCNKWLLTLVIPLLCIGMMLIDIARYNALYFLFYVLGYSFQKYGIIKKINNWIISLSFFLFTLLCGHFVYGNALSGNPNRYMMELPISILASLSFIWLFYKWDKKGYKINTYLSYIGKFTLGIYLCHYFLLYLKFLPQIDYNVSPVVLFVILLILSTLISYCCIAIQRIVANFEWLHGIMYGNWNFISQKKST